MKFKAVLLLSATAFLLTGCVQAPHKEIPTVKLTKSFDPNSVKFIHEKGESTLSGQAFLKQNGGTVVTCAGNAVYLIPFSEYAHERMQHIYNNVFNDDSTHMLVFALKFDPEHPEYMKYTKSSTCNATGNFSFKNIPEGEYFVSTQVSWKVGYQLQGGILAKRIKVPSNETVDIIMSL